MRRDCARLPPKLNRAIARREARLPYQHYTTTCEYNPPHKKNGQGEGQAPANNVPTNTRGALEDPMVRSCPTPPGTAALWDASFTGRPEAPSVSPLLKVSPVRAYGANVGRPLANPIQILIKLIKISQRFPIKILLKLRGHKSLSLVFPFFKVLAGFGISAPRTRLLSWVKHPRKPRKRTFN